MKPTVLHGFDQFQHENYSDRQADDERAWADSLLTIAMMLSQLEGVMLFRTGKVGHA